MPDGNPYRVLRGGNWYNGAEYYGHGRIANRDPAYFRGPDDPNHPYYHVGFRVARPATSVATGVTEPGAALVTRAGGLGFCEGPAADAGGNISCRSPSAARKKLALAGPINSAPCPLCRSKPPRINAKTARSWSFSQRNVSSRTGSNGCPKRRTSAP